MKVGGDLGDAMWVWRNAKDRGHADHGWLKTYHTFSFSGYQDPKWMGFRALRVINEDRVAPLRGFDTHFHNNMEILSFVLQGTLAHRDSMENGSFIQPGEVQLMGAGTGVFHSEYNPSSVDEVHFLQVWILPHQEGLAPRYEQQNISHMLAKNGFRLLASPMGGQGGLAIRQDVNVFMAQLEAGEESVFSLIPNRYTWIQAIRGPFLLDEKRVLPGDGVGFANDKKEMRIQAQAQTEFLLFDLA